MNVTATTNYQLLIQQLLYCKKRKIMRDTISKMIKLISSNTIKYIKKDAPTRVLWCTIMHAQSTISDLELLYMYILSPHATWTRLSQYDRIRSWLITIQPPCPVSPKLRNNLIETNTAFSEQSSLYFHIHWNFAGSLYWPSSCVSHYLSFVLLINAHN